MCRPTFSGFSFPKSTLCNLFLARSGVDCCPITEISRARVRTTRKAPQFQIDEQTGRLLDPTESNQNIRYRGLSLNPFYIISTSSPDVDKDVMTNRFGNFAVIISDPLVLLERIRAVWRNHEWALNDGIAIVSADYDKGELVADNEYLFAPPQYSYSQKPPSFSVESEYRYVLKCSIDMNRRLERSPYAQCGGLC